MTEDCGIYTQVVINFLLSMMVGGRSGVNHEILPPGDRASGFR